MMQHRFSKDERDLSGGLPGSHGEFVEAMENRLVESQGRIIVSASRWLDVSWRWTAF